MPRFLSIFVFLHATLLSAAPMVRVIAVRNATTLVVDRNGIASEVRLARIVLPPGDDEAATAFLRRTVESSWVLVETDADGGSYVYRSPDGLYVNGELARRPYASPVHGGIYLGPADATPLRASPATPRKKAAPAAVTKPRLTPVRHRPRGSHRVPRL